MTELHSQELQTSNKNVSMANMHGYEVVIRAIKHQHFYNSKSYLKTINSFIFPPREQAQIGFINSRDVRLLCIQTYKADLFYFLNTCSSNLHYKA